MKSAGSLAESKLGDGPVEVSQSETWTEIWIESGQASETFGEDMQLGPAQADLGPWKERRDVEAAFRRPRPPTWGKREQSLANNPKWNKHKKPQRGTCQSNLLKTDTRETP